MNWIPKRLKRPRMLHKDETVVRCHSHLQWIRGHECAIAGRGEHLCLGKTIAAHVRVGTDGSTSKKPGDNWTIPLCESMTGGAHKEQHQIGERAFEKRYGISMKEIAAALWEKSPAGKRFRAKSLP